MKYVSIFKFYPGPGLLFADFIAKSRYGKEKLFSFSHDGMMEVYVGAEDEKRIADLGLSFFSDKKKFQKYKKEIEKLIPEFISFSKTVDRLNFSEISDQQLWNFFKESGQKFIKYLDHYFFTEFFCYSMIEKKIEKWFEGKYSKSEIAKNWSIALTSPAENNIVTREQIERYRICLEVLRDPRLRELVLTHKALNNKSFMQLIDRHIKEFGYINYKDGGIFSDQKSLLSELENDLEMPESAISQFILDTEQHKTKSLENYERVCKELALSTSERYLIDTVREMQEIKYELRIFLNKLFLNEQGVVQSFLREMSRRRALAFNQVKNMTSKEIVALFFGRQSSVVSTNQRQKHFAFVRRLVGWQILEGERAKKFIDNIIIKTDDVKIIKGAIANYGFTKGGAKIIRLTDRIDLIKEEIEKMETGQILVADTTGPELILACRKASAIVTNEGGINSHAAIVSRELNIPCVVGTKIATDLIKDDDIIEVDADKGIVRIVK